MTSLLCGPSFPVLRFQSTNVSYLGILPLTLLTLALDWLCIQLQSLSYDSNTTVHVTQATASKTSSTYL